ncbi:MAG: thermonuclease family protein [Pseudomonadota bacterium]
MVLRSVVAGLSVLVAVGCLSVQAAADARRSVVEIDKVSERGRLLLANGDEICLAGIRAPMAPNVRGWRAAWQRLVEDVDLFQRTDRPDEHDRYGCVFARLENVDGVPLQELLLTAGWALVDPLSGVDQVSDIDAMLSLEDRARAAKQGMWKAISSRPKAADDLSDWIGTRQLVEGRVRRVSETKRYVYLNFGNDWRTDFTTRLDRKMIQKTGFDAEALDGKRLRVRGVLVESRGPLIDITHLKQIEFLP